MKCSHRLATVLTLFIVCDGAFAQTTIATPQANAGNVSQADSSIIATATVIIAIATVIYVAAALLLWWTTKQSVDITRQAFEAAHRPYIGATVAKRAELTSPERIELSVTFINAGTVSAHDVKSSLLIIIDGNFLQRAAKEEEGNLVVLPSQSTDQIAVIHEAQDLAAVRGASSLSLLFKCTYKGPTEKEYSYQQKYTYHRISGHFDRVKTTTV
jgi:hypothetical protein